MKNGTPFEVSKEVYERACQNGGYMAGEDIGKHFNDSIIMGFCLIQIWRDKK